MRRALRDEGGAIAVMVTVVVAAVLVPLAALGISAYVRAGVASENNQAADAGALAGAARIPLGDVDFAQTYAAATVSDPGAPLPSRFATRLDAKQRLEQLLPPNAPDNPLTVACDVTLDAIAHDNRFSAPYAEPYETGGKPDCAASYTSDQTFLGRFGACLDSLVDPTAPDGLNHAVPGVETLAGILPALLRPGVTVHLTWRVKGPLDSVVEGTAAAIRQDTESSARRVIKSAVVVTSVDLPGPLPTPPMPTPPMPTPPMPTPPLPTPPTPPMPLPTGRPSALPSLHPRPMSAALVGATSPNPSATPSPGTSIPLSTADAATRSATLNALAELEYLTSPLLQPFGCDGVFAALSDDFLDATAPTGNGGPTSAQQMLQDSFDNANWALAVRFSSSLTGVDAAGSLAGLPLNTPSIPLLDFVPVCLTRNQDEYAGVVIAQRLPITHPRDDAPVTVNDSGVACTVAGPGAFRSRLVK